jgi:hypothetical protein
MSAHVILKGAEWMLSSERAAQAPDALYVAQCLVCRAESGLVDNDPKQAGVWAIEHARRSGREHCQFRVTSEKHWRVDPVAAAVGNRPQPPVRPPLPRGRWRLRRAVGLAGPLVLAALAVVFAGCGYLLGAAAGTGAG